MNLSSFICSAGRLSSILSSIDGLSLHLNTPGWFVAEFGYKQGEHLINEVNDRFKGSKANVYKDYSGNDRILLVKNEKS